MFIKTNDRLVNLKNVSDIKFISKQNRIVFNMTYSVSFGKDSKLISDYVYWDSSNSYEFEAKIDQISKNSYVCSNYIDRRDNGFVNIDEISSIKTIDFKKRVIFNLSHPVTFRAANGESNITSEFIYLNFDTTEEYQVYIDRMNVILGSKES